MLGAIILVGVQEEVDMRCIVVTTDGSDGANRAVDFAADLAGKLSAELVLTHVISASTLASVGTDLAHSAADLRVPMRVENTSMSEVLTDAANDILAKAKARAEAKGARRVHAEIRAGQPAETILAVAKEHAADAIVLGKRGQGRLAGLLLGSVSQKVMTLASCPVIVIP
jgi:nucleotide-binding universal stress UspA family protein